MQKNGIDSVSRLKDWFFVKRNRTKSVKLMKVNILKICQNLVSNLSKLSNRNGN